MRATGVEAWSLVALNPNRLTFLAQLARKSSAQALQRSPAVRRYPLLVAFLVHCLATVTDEVLEMFDRCLADAYARAGKDLEPTFKGTKRTRGIFLRKVLSPSP